MSSEYSWPEYSHLGISTALLREEACVAELAGGRKLQGSLLQFAPDERVLKLRPRDGQPADSVSYDQLQVLRLTRPLGMGQSVSRTEIFAGQPGPVRERFQVELSAATVLTGETFAYTPTKHGLFLLPVDNSGSALRWFIPAGACKSYQIGERLGEILVGGNLATPQDIDSGLRRQHDLRRQRIGDYLMADRIVSPEQLALAIKRQKSAPMLKLGEALVLERLVTPAQLDSALERQRQDRKLPLGRILVEMGVIDDEILKSTLAKKLGVPVVDLRKFNVDLTVVSLIDESVAFKHLVMPLCRNGASLIVATDDPMNWERLDEIRFHTKLNVEPVLAAAEDIQHARRTYYGSATNLKLGDLASEMAAGIEPKETVEQAVHESDNVLVKLVNKMILDAHNQAASDIHVETGAGRANTRIRFRKDGVMAPYFELPAAYRNALVSRIKIMCDLDISERRKPQDGKINFAQYGPARIELRVATVPLSDGREDVVMRILSGAKPIPLNQIGFHPTVLERIQEIAARPHGLFLVCGPTGSGKTTTLHSVLGYVNTPERKIGPRRIQSKSPRTD